MNLSWQLDRPKVACQHQKMAQKAAETDCKNDVANGYYGSAGDGEGYGSIVDREIVMVVPVRWLGASRLADGEPKWWQH